MSESKACKCCSSPFSKRKRDSMAQWNGREFCSLLCANRSKKEKTAATERFWNFVKVAAQSDCWPWLGSKDDKGYGQICDEAGLSPLKAHRVSWEVHFFPVPDGLNVCHACDNPACVNPNHLLLGTQMANMIDAERKGRINPESLLNLCPGAPGFLGAGPLSNRELDHGFIA